jgi:hypothetical protein
MTRILTYTGIIPKDTEDLTKEQDQEILRRMNAGANLALMAAMNYETEEGKLAFEKVHQTRTDTGYGSGVFPDAWANLKKLYKEDDLTSKSKAQSKYFDLRMKMEDNPAYYIMKLNKRRLEFNRLEKGLDKQITEEDMVNNILVKLPASKEQGALTPYQNLKIEIEATIKKSKRPFPLSQLELRLKQVYKELYPDKEDEDNEESNTGEKAFAAQSRQFKGHCNKCGKIGHKGADCRSSNNNQRKNQTRGGWTNNKKNHKTNKNNGAGSNKKFDGVCFYCGKKGHRASECFKKKREQGNRDSANTAKDKGEIAFTGICLPVVHHQEDDYLPGFFDYFSNSGKESDDDSVEDMPTLYHQESEDTQGYSDDSSGYEVDYGDMEDEDEEDSYEGPTFDPVLEFEPQDEPRKYCYWYQPYPMVEAGSEASSSKDVASSDDTRQPDEEDEDMEEDVPRWVRPKVQITLESSSEDLEDDDSSKSSKGSGSGGMPGLLKRDPSDSNSEESSM